MNSLSWTLYLIEVVNNISLLLGMAAVAILIGAGGYTLAVSLDREEFTPARTRWPVLAGILLTISCFIPAKGTMYAIAASEVGERIAATPAAQELSADALKAVSAWIKSQIKDDKK